MFSTKPRSWPFSWALVCESRCNCSVFSFLLIRHLAAATLFFSRDALRLSSSGLLVLSCAALVRFRPPAFLCLGRLLSSEGVKGSLPWAFPRLRFVVGCSEMALVGSRPFLDG